MRLYPVGRLDKEITGLILLANNGDLVHRLTHPGFEHEKKHLKKVKALLKKGEIQRLEQSIKLEGGKTAPAKVRKLAEGEYGYNINIHEGKQRQLKRVLRALGKSVLERKRVRVGNLKLGDLEEYVVREVRSPE
jgi:pseudouridine synthase